MEIHGSLGLSSREIYAISAREEREREKKKKPLASGELKSILLHRTFDPATVRLGEGERSYFRLTFAGTIYRYESVNATLQ